MDITLTDPPRSFEVGIKHKIKLQDCASVYLKPNEQVTFKTESSGEYDVVRKSWGFYATPSLNGRLPQFGLRAVLIKNTFDKYFLCLVEQGCEADFQTYLESDRLKIVCWLDSTSQLQQFEKTALV
jgi:hypothetical protein